MVDTVHSLLTRTGINLFVYLYAGMTGGKGYGMVHECTTYCNTQAIDPYIPGPTKKEGSSEADSQYFSA